MLGLRNESMLVELYHTLLDQINSAEPIGEATPIVNDKLFCLILYHNGCAFSDDAVFTRYRFGVDKLNSIRDYAILYVYGAKGNEVNEFYDYIEFYGMKYLVIFMDYFKDYHKPRVKQEDDPLEFAIGKSIYYDAIKKLVEIVLATTVSMAEFNSPALAATSAATNYRFAPTIIAALILHNTIGFEPEDVSDINYDNLLGYITSTTPEILLAGVRGIKDKN